MMTRPERWFWLLLITVSAQLGVMALLVHFDAPFVWLLGEATLGQWVCGYVAGRNSEVRSADNIASKASGRR